MVLTSLSLPDRQRMAAALRAGEPVDLDLQEPAPRDVRLDELAPLFRRARAQVRADAVALEAFAAPGARPLEPGEHRPAVTVVVPTHRQVPKGVAAWLDQDVPVRVIVLSNGAGGPSRVAGADVVRVPWAGHGATRQNALALVDSPYVCMTVDDALPLGRGMLRSLVDALEGRPWEAAVARQIPWPDADPVTRTRLRAWTPPGHQVHAAPQADHVCTLHRASLLRQHPLPDVPIAEDAWWSQRRHVAYVPSAPVLHSHRRSPMALYRRNRDIHAQLVAMGAAPTVSSAAGVAGALPGLLRPVWDAGAAELLNQAAELLGQWRGAALGARQRARQETR